MSTTCPQGHTSATTDYCDQCGARMEGNPDAGATTELQLEDLDDSSTRAVLVEPCPKCGTTRVVRDQFCEECGYDFVAQSGGANTSTVAAQPTDGGWELVVEADRAYYDSLETESVTFPDSQLPRRFVLDRDAVRVGRRSRSRGVTPEIDLSSEPEDTGISHLHLQFSRDPDGNYTLTDLGSTNGTTVNHGAPITPDVAVTLMDGDRIHLGAWTAITVRRITEGTGA